MGGWFIDVTCIIHVSFFLVMITVAFLNTVTGHSLEIRRRKENDTSPILPKRCGIYQQKLFCLTTVLCNKHCSRECSKISSFELLNLQILSSEAGRIQKFSVFTPLDTNLRINYYDVEMTGMEPAFCGNYSTFEMPIYSIKESKSKGIQFLHKLYFQSYRDVYTHSMCNSQCVFDCRLVGYDAEIMTELLLRNISDLHVYQCDSVHSWVYILVIIIIFIILLMIIACCMRNKMSNIHGNTKGI
uniref:Uncharacterized protein n=1 Tax=Onchocerca volvulus TaxID=6282 RepID=A0A8R1TIQ8_ONCVO